MYFPVNIDVSNTCAINGGNTNAGVAFIPISMCLLSVCQERLFVFEWEQRSHLQKIILFMLRTPEQTSIHYSCIHQKKARSVRSHKRQHNNVFYFISLTEDITTAGPVLNGDQILSSWSGHLCLTLLINDDPFFSSSFQLLMRFPKAIIRSGWKYICTFIHIKHLLPVGGNEVNKWSARSLCHYEFAQQVASCLTSGALTPEVHCTHTYSKWLMIQTQGIT